ncbi:MAG: precorrin-6A reductase [Bacillota bacterium]|jgi:precorrin-6A/cobalt-precorrin-6A reductase|nr:precorrin-6A reductase [Clostridia bacterium]
MILILGGTSDALEIANAIYSVTREIIVSTATEYGFEVSQERFPGKSIYGRMEREDLRKFIRSQGIKYVVDATHPYAENISRNAVAVCRELGVQYLRFERAVSKKDDYDKIICRDPVQAGDLIENLPGKVFITTGINHIKKMVSKISDKKRLIIRVLPQSETIKKLETLGFNADQIIGMKGPFSREMNYLMFRQTEAAVLVCKDSGAAGGTDDKLAAAACLGMKIILIQRPDLLYPNRFNEISTIIDYLTACQGTVL